MGSVTIIPARYRPQQAAVSVCIANYNGERLLPDCLDSVLMQELDELEIIVHDDASSDSSVDLLRRDYPQVEVLASAENVGFCIANNRLVDHAQGEFVLLLNNDAALLPGALSSLLAATQETARAGILTLPQYDWATGRLVDLGCSVDPFYNPVPNVDAARSDVAMVMGACLWIPRSLWIRLGGFPDWFESMAEDLYLCCAARLVGLNVACLSVSGYRHRQGRSFGGNKPTAGRLVSTYRRRRLSERNKTFVLVMMTPTLLLWPLLTLHLLLLAVEGAMLAILKGDRNLWLQIYGNVMAELWRHRKRLLLRRELIQRQRRVSLSSYLRGFTIVPRKFAMLLRYGVPSVE